MRVYFDNTPITFSRYNGVGNVGLHLYSALKKHSSFVEPQFLYRKKSRKQNSNINYLKQFSKLIPRQYHPYLSFGLAKSGTILHSSYHYAAHLPFLTKVVHIHDTWTLRKNTYQSERFQYVQSKKLAKVLKRADYFTVMSQTVKNELIDSYHIEPDRIAIIGYGCPQNLDNALNNETDKQSNSPFNETELSQKKYILSIGRIEHRKNYHHSMQVLKRFPQLKWIVIGDLGYQGEKIVQECLKPLESTGQLIWARQTSRQTLEKLYRQAFAFLMPSYEEGFGIPLLEAMSYGIPVITSNRSACLEVTKNGGYQVDPFNWNNSVQFIESLIQNPSLHDEYSRRAKTRALDFTWRKVVKKMETFYSTINQNNRCEQPSISPQPQSVR